MIGRAVTHPISVQEMLEGYRQGRFLMSDAVDSPRLFWLRPEERGVMPMDSRFHIPRKLRRKLSRGQYEVRSDANFASILTMCAECKGDRTETWINGPLRDLYMALYRVGSAHSVEVWEGETLRGGLFGIHLGGAFFGESMVSRAPDVSKIALVHLVLMLQRQGFTLLDTQYPTSHLEQFGGVTVSASFYQSLLHEALQKDAQWCSDVSLGTIVTAR